MSVVQKLVTEDSFVNGVFVPGGQVASYDEKQLNGKEPHIHDVGDTPLAVVQMAAISPTGPNATAPQQISPDTIQGPGGGYFRPGAVIVGERTAEAEVRLAGLPEEGDTAESDFADQLREAQEETARLRAELAGRPAAAAAGDDNDDLVAGNVAEIKASLGERSDEELEALRVAELDRERPRKGVTDAIKAELASRQG